MIPRATYRVQFHGGFTFADAIPLAPYWAGLGISHLYASPIATARPGSMHGYDVVDPTQINTELGGEEGFRALAAALRQAGLGVILDIVPNHLAVGGSENRWWLDVLEKGEKSPYAGLFDIDWRPLDESLTGKVLAPFLGSPYADALAAGDIRLERDDEGLAAVAHDIHRFPIRSDDAEQLLANDAEDLAGFDPSHGEGRARLHALLERQNFRLAWWRSAGDEINWRRFFDIIELAGVRIETDEAFELIHGLPLRLYAEGLIDGLRADHVDGLADPAGYCRRLRARLEALAPHRRALGLSERPYLVVEKILAWGEPLAPDWAIDGTTGYDFMNEVSALLHAPEGAAPLAGAWADISGRSGDFQPEERSARAEILAHYFPGQLDGAARAFHRLAEAALATRDIDLRSLSRALSILLAGFPVYRTYATAEGLPAWDEPVLAEAIARAKASAPGADALVLDRIFDWIKGRHEPALRGEAVRRLQQLSAPVAAKAVEDTAFYRYGRLLSRNDVGFDPGRFSGSIEQTHAAFAGRAPSFPHALLATATHDHKRGEDVRARLAVLSEIPELWLQRARGWAELNGAWDDDVDPGDEYMLYQTLAGAWPLDLGPDDREGLVAFRARVAGWLIKALREAKLRTSWTEPSETYEAACLGLLERITDPSRSATFLHDMAGLVGDIAAAGALNGLAQTLLRCTAPGAPDLYQGAEFWDGSLVDPDNRRPVDYAARMATLDQAGPAGKLAAWRTGAVKQALIARALQARRNSPELFAEGDYQPLLAKGPRAGSVFAFLRRHGGKAALVAVAIRCAPAVLGAPLPLPRREWWQGTTIRLPEHLAGVSWWDALGSGVAPSGGVLEAAELFAGMTTALLTADAERSREQPV
jgi:(1->4)-alpha-D-glucan 1-alpha-D-glucosylmutase